MGLLLADEADVFRQQCLSLRVKFCFFTLVEAAALIIRSSTKIILQQDSMAAVSELVTAVVAVALPMFVAEYQSPMPYSLTMWPL